MFKLKLTPFILVYGSLLHSVTREVWSVSSENNLLQDARKNGNTFSSYAVISFKYGYDTYAKRALLKYTFRCIIDDTSVYHVYKHYLSGPSYLRLDII